MYDSRTGAHDFVKKEKKKRYVVFYVRFLGFKNADQFGRILICGFHRR